MGRIAKPRNRRGLLARFEPGCVQQNMAVDMALIAYYDPLLSELERDSEKTAHGHEPVSLARLRTSPGVGNILARVLRYEIEQIARFPRVQEFVSACRLGKSAKASHGNRYGTSGKKIGNAHRTWAFSEAAVLLLTNNAPAPKYLAKLATRHATGKALSILAHTRGRAVYCMLKQQGAFDPEKFLATEGWRERTSLASHWSHRGSGISPAPRTKRSCSWDLSPHQRCLCRTAVPASYRVDGRAVPLLELSAPRTPAWLPVLPLPRARNELDGMRACRAHCVDWAGTRVQPCFQGASGNAPCAAAAHCGRLAPRYVLGAGPRLVPKPACCNQAEAVTRPKVREGAGEKNASLFRTWRSVPLDSRRPYKG